VYGVNNIRYLCILTGDLGPIESAKLKGIIEKIQEVDWRRPIYYYLEQTHTGYIIPTFYIYTG